MHLLVTEICTFLLQTGALWDICLVHCGICEMGLFTGCFATHDEFLKCIDAIVFVWNLTNLMMSSNLWHKLSNRFVTRDPFHWHGIIEIRAWIINCIYNLIWYVITDPCPNFTADQLNRRLTWMGNYIPLFYMDMITYPYPNPDTDWANLGYLLVKGCGDTSSRIYNLTKTVLSIHIFYTLVPHYL